jgi:hypothetical protein
MDEVLAKRLALRQLEKSKLRKEKYFNNYREIQKLINLDLQQKNKFKFLLIPNFDSFKIPSASSIITSVLTGTSTLLGNAVISTYLQSVTFPSSFGIEYHELTKTAKGLVRPEQVSMTFLEDENGSVWRYFQDWRKSIAYVAPQKAGGFKNDGGLLGSAGQAANVVTSGLKSLFSSYDTEYVFADNQLASEATGILMLQKSSSEKLSYSLKLKGQFPRIMFYGLKFKQIEDTSVSNTESGVMTHTITFSCREVAAPLV